MSQLGLSLSILAIDCSESNRWSSIDPIYGMPGTGIQHSRVLVTLLRALAMNKITSASHNESQHRTTTSNHSQACSCGMIDIDQQSGPRDGYGILNCRR